MRLNVEPRLPWDIEADVLAVTVPDSEAVPEHLMEIDRRLDGALGELRSVGAAKGTLWAARLLPGRDMAARFVLLVGVADGSAIDRLGARRLGAVMVKALAGIDVGSMVVHLPDELAARGGVPQAALVEMLVRGLVEGAEDPSTVYNKPGDTLPPRLESVTFAIESAAPHRLVRQTGPDGEELALLGSERLAYWKLNAPGGEKHLAEIGLGGD